MTDSPIMGPRGEGSPDPGSPGSGAAHGGWEPDDGFRIDTSVFYGPIDLLFYLIRKSELDIHEISLADIAREYLEYVEMIRLVDLERAGDFLSTASALMKIKSRSLFDPAWIETAAGEGEDDQERALIRYLLEYQRLGGAVDRLAERETERRGVYPRGGEKTRILDEYARRGNAPDYVLYDLLSALREVLSTAPKGDSHEVEIPEVTPEMKSREILDLIARNGKADFIAMVRGQPRIVIIVTFISMLELIRNGRIRVSQSRQFGRIVLYDAASDAHANP